MQFDSLTSMIPFAVLIQIRSVIF